MPATPLLSALFEGKPETDRILVWSLEGKRSRWFDSPALIDPSSFGGNTYFGAGAVSKDTATAAGEFKRSTSKTVSGIGAVWLDVDIAGPAHKKGSLPATATEALTLVETAFHGLEPSYIIDSGHGLQLYWLLESWYEFSTTAMRDNTAALLLDFNTHWRSVSKANGFDADSVCDLARVMRLPGSTNHKVPSDLKAVVEIKSKPEIRYGLAQIRGWLTTNATDKAPDMKPRKTRPATTDTGPDIAELDADKWEALYESDHRVKQSWNHEREDIKDQSPSAYDMSLMTFAVRAEWPDAEVIALAIACRRKHGLEIKPHALRFTLTKVHEEQAALRAKEEAATGATPEAKLKALSDELGFGIGCITRFDSTPPAYVLSIEDGQKIHLGTIDGLTDQRKFRNTVAATVGILPQKMKGDLWDTAVQTLLDCLEHDSAGAEATDDGQITEWINAYLNAVTVHGGADDTTNRDNGLIAGEPWVEAGTVHITGTPFRSWLTVHLGDRIDSRKLGLLLRAIGSEPCTVALRSDGESRRTRSAWKINRKVWSPK